MTKEQAVNDLGERAKALNRIIKVCEEAKCPAGQYREMEEMKDAIETVLSMLEEKDKTIDLMSEFIEDELTVDEFCTKEGCYADNYIDGHCEKCLNCIKQYFENKAKEVEQWKT